MALEGATETNETEHPGRMLWLEMQSVIAPWPKGVAAVPEPIRGTAFFPGGYGLWQEGSTTMGAFPTDSVMIVGQDFNSLGAYERACLKGSEIGTSTTWRNLIPILAEAGVPAETCFFTNVYMGLRDGGKETGRFPGSRDHDFVARCSRFFDRQLAVSRPKLILVLGLEPLRVLSPSLLNVTAPATLTACDRIYDSVRQAGGFRTVVVVLTHPSFYHANVWRRRYGSLTGSAAEQAMISDGYRTAFGESARVHDSFTQK
jgi:uracil-DNA glycosylase